MNLRTAEKFISQHNEARFTDIALYLFRYHLEHNAVYSRFCKELGVKPEQITNFMDIPFLPVSLFRSERIMTVDTKDQLVFESSGTSGEMTSKHFIPYPALYEKAFTHGFRLAYGDPSGFAILALLPSYLERKNSSLVYMVSRLISLSDNSHSGFYLNNTDELYQKLLMLKKANCKTILIGVSFALLDFAEKFSVDYPGLSIVETGGMKGRRKEITRIELHSRLKQAFYVKRIHSEYGMTELCSQAWSKQDGVFVAPSWMKVLIRDTVDPLTLLPIHKTGGINIIDFANAFSCPFIATDDLGKINADGSFEVTGRYDHVDIRGCNTMID
jgi:hypothetical protein